MRINTFALLVDTERLVISTLAPSATSTFEFPQRQAVGRICLKKLQRKGMIGIGSGVRRSRTSIN